MHIAQHAIGKVLIEMWVAAAADQALSQLRARETETGDERFALINDETFITPTPSLTVTTGQNTQAVALPRIQTSGALWDHPC